MVGLPNNERSDWLAGKLGRLDIVFFQDGPLLRQMTIEAIRCFVRGDFMATVLLASSIVERSIAGRLLAIGDTDARDDRSMTQLLKRAVTHRWMTSEEKRRITSLCDQYRNSLAHIRTTTEPSRHEVRARESTASLTAVLEGDARTLLELTLLVLAKTAL
jgi:hypothetical protein